MSSEELINGKDMRLGSLGPAFAVRSLEVEGQTPVESMSFLWRFLSEPHSRKRVFAQSRFCSGSEPLRCAGLVFVGGRSLLPSWAPVFLSSGRCLELLQTSWAWSGPRLIQIKLLGGSCIQKEAKGKPERPSKRPTHRGPPFGLLTLLSTDP